MQQDLRRSGRERRFSGKYIDFISYGSFLGGTKMSTDDESRFDDPTSYEKVLWRLDRGQ